MKIFVWRGEKVLKNYSSGMVIVAANSEDEAWDKLKKNNFRAWIRLQSGINHVWTEEELEFCEESDKEWNEPIKPISYNLEELPVLIMEGSE